MCLCPEVMDHRPRNAPARASMRAGNAERCLQDVRTAAGKLGRCRLPSVRATNRYGLPAIYEIHVQAWRANPLRSNADWNTHVTCNHLPTNRAADAARSAGHYRPTRETRGALESARSRRFDHDRGSCIRCSDGASCLRRRRSGGCRGVACVSAHSCLCALATACARDGTPSFARIAET